MNEEIFEKAENFTIELIDRESNADHLFHNRLHSKQIVQKTEELLDADNSNSIHREYVLTAAWFLTIGFILDYKDHVRQSSDSAKKFLSQNGYGEDIVQKICGLIEAVWEDKAPEDEEVAILKDANTAYYASDNFEELLELLRMELENFDFDVPKIEEWRLQYIELLRTKHHYYTDYARENWQKQKKENIDDLVSSITKARKKKKKEKLKVKLKNESPERAIQSLYRTQLRNHIKLSDIADTKANILLSVNAIIISLLLANLIPTLDDPKNSYLIYPTVIFVIFSIASIIMSVLATRPKIENEKVVSESVGKKDTNYLFFGTFHALDLSEFKERIRSIIESKEAIYDSLTMDLYYLGKVLKKKYQLLRWTYTVFIIGIILSVLAFAIALKYYGMEQEILDAVTPDPK